MKVHKQLICAATVFAVWISGPCMAQTAAEAGLLDRLKAAGPQGWEQVEQELALDWSKSGSASADLLLARARAALDAQDRYTALGHLNALTDHAPDFAEGWQMRAVVFFELDNYAMAMSDLRRTLALNPNHYGAWMGVSRILEDTGDIPGALAAIRRAAAIHPHRPDIKEAQERLSLAVEGRKI
jgi:tetratricopeptide (TPR) repeat protein